MGKYHNKSKFYYGVNPFWVIQRNEPVIDILKKLGNQKAAKSVSTQDFLMLYTSALVDKLIKTPNFVIAFFFKGKIQNKILSVTTAYLTDVNLLNILNFTSAL